MTSTTTAIAIVLVALSALLPPASAQKRTIKVLTTRAIWTVLDKIGPEFERANQCSLDVTTDIAARMVRGVRNGEPFDVLVAAPDQLEALEKDGFIRAGSRVDLVRSPIGVAVRAGATAPDVSSIDAFKRALLNAKSVAFLREGQSGVYLAGVLETLGLSPGIDHKVVRPDTDIVAELVAKGDVELGIVVVTQILTTPGVRLAGALPPEIQRPIVFGVGVSARAASGDTATALVRFLTSPTAHAVMRAQGMEPLASTAK